jgi:hypothetical protein
MNGKQTKVRPAIKEMPDADLAFIVGRIKKFSR